MRGAMPWVVGGARPTKVVVMQGRHWCLLHSMGERLVSIINPNGSVRPWQVINYM